MEENTIKEAISSKADTQEKETNETLSTELHFELFKQYAWLSSAVIGAIVILIQLKAIEMSNDVLLPLACLGTSILISIFGQDAIVGNLANGKKIVNISKQLVALRFAAMFALGMGAGTFSGLFIW